MAAYDLTEVHKANLSILKEIDRICRTYKIKYMIDSGTLLGAVRHKGFIPWDDDSDIAFTRTQYEAFLKVAARELPPGMRLLLPDEFQGGRAFYDFTARITYENSMVHQDSEEVRYYEGKLNHIYVDLFVIDKLPAGKTARQVVLLLQTVIYGLSMGHRCRLDYRKYQGVQKLAVRGLAAAGRLVPMKRLFRLQQKVSLLCRKSNSTRRYYSNYAPDYYYVQLDREGCEEITEMEFEGMMLMAPKGWHQVLTLIYGDYMQLPPPDKRVPAHSSTRIQIFDIDVEDTGGRE